MAQAQSVRVCQIISSFHPVVGGAERATKTLCEACLARGLDVIVVTRRYPGLPPFEEIAGIPVYRLGHPSRSKLGSLTFAAHTVWSLATRFRNYRVVHAQNIDVPLLVGFVCKLLLGCFVVATIHGGGELAEKKETRLGRLRVKLLALLADTVTALNEPMQRQLLDGGVPPSRIRIVPNSIDTTRFRPPDDSERCHARAELGIDASERVVLYVGRLIELKRVDLLLHAWSRLTGTEADLGTLLIVGDGPARASLEQTAADLDLQDRVRFEGTVRDVVPYLHAADAFVLPSQKEGLSVALLEAMATGLPVIVTAVPGNESVVSHLENGLVVPVDDLQALVECLELSLQTPALRRKLGSKARETICATYSLETIVTKYQTLYEAAMNGRHPVTIEP